MTTDFEEKNNQVGVIYIRLILKDELELGKAVEMELIKRNLGRFLSEEGYHFMLCDGDTLKIESKETIENMLKIPTSEKEIKNMLKSYKLSEQQTKG